MRRSIFFLLAVCLAMAACSETSGPERRSLIGTWSSSGFARGSVLMTLTESSRNVNGAGSWTEPAQARAFRVAGVHAEQVVSLIFQFQGSPEIHFRGEFTDKNTLAGTLTGGEFRDQPIGFVREERKRD